MREIIVHNQKELDAAISQKDALIIIKDTTEPLKVSGGTIKYVYGGTIQYVSGGTIQEVYGGTIQYVYGGTIQYVSGGTIQYVSGGTIQYVSGGTIQKVSGGTIQYVSGGTIQKVYGGTIQYVYGGTIQYVSGGTIQYVYGGTIQHVSGNAIIQVYSATVIIESCCMMAVIIMIGCICKIKRKTKTVTIIKNKIAKYKKTDFIMIHHANLINKDTIKLYKSVQKDNTDFYTGKIKYEGKVICPDFKSDTSIECGYGLHLSPTPELARSYNDGKILECAVKLKDFVVYGGNITKVRCRRVKVLGEYCEGQK